MSSQVKQFFKLIRIKNLGIIVLTLYVTRLFVIGPKNEYATILFEHDIFLLTLGVVLIAAAGYIINDYYDIKIDVINKPDRVVIDRYFKRRTVILMQVFLNFSAAVIGLLLGLKIFTIYVLSIFCLWLYSNKLKRMPLLGNVMVAFLTSLSVLLLAIYYNKNQAVVYSFAIFAFFISVIREILKDLEDMEGDLIHGCKTLPISIGIRRTKWVIYTCSVVFAACICLISFTHLESKIFYLLAVSIFPALIFLNIRLYRADTNKKYHFLSTFCKIMMLLGVLGITLN